MGGVSVGIFDGGVGFVGAFVWVDRARVRDDGGYDVERCVRYLCVVVRVFGLFL